MTQTPDHESTTPMAPATPEPPTVPFSATPPATPPTSPYAAPTAPYAAPTPPYAAPAAPYTAPAPAPYAAPAQPTASPYAAPATPQPYAAPAPDGSQPPASPYAVPAVPPVSGQPAYGHPYTDQPLSAPPYGMPAVATARKPRRTAVIVLSILAGLLFISSGVLGGMFVVQRGETDRGNVEIAAQNADLTAKAKKIEELQTNLDSVNSANILQQQELDGSKNDRNEQERQKKVVSKCLDLLLEAFAADTESQFDKKIRAAEKTCDEADKYM
ncbi:hypothetical protein Ais01nite_51900 [Asanoa ishikariensis]|nr:hypothetical protein [Asanoa ishikariensis]GIF67155.1 hypothetical protein Ais01nite_51900 [Asanoa ishikariensis]